MRLFILVSLLFLVSCQKPLPNQLIVGVISGPEADLLKTASEITQQKHGVHLKIVEFNDYNLPNIALQDKSIDVNVFQHLPYLKAASENHGYDFEMAGKAFLFPIALYSKKIKSVNELRTKAQIAVPNDPSNEMRALILLEKAGLIELKKTEETKIAANPLNDIISNPKSITIKEIDAAQLPRVLDDVDAAIINTNFAKVAGLSQAKDAIFIEGKDSPYAVVVVSRKDSSKKQQIKYLVEALHSNQVRDKAEALFAKEAIPAW